MIFNYKWTLKNANFTENKGTVFSCFSCGGGSTMGYKLAGFHVIGINEIDPKMTEVYIKNFNPKYSFLEDIKIFKQRKNLPEELYNLNILDGSPPCSSFSMTGNREKDWGKKKKFREGQTKQILDNLFFDFIDLTKKLQPKVVIAENVQGILMGNAIKYVRKIYKEFDKAGYNLQHYLLDGSKMGLPQRRKRVFFIGLKKKLANSFLYQKDLFTIVPKLILEFNEKEIPFKNIEDKKDLNIIKKTKVSDLWELVEPGKTFTTAQVTGNLFSHNKSDPNRSLPTILSNPTSGSWHYSIKRLLNENELKLAGSFPLDYNFLKINPKYLIGMSVPPIMMAQISNQIFNQWLNKIK